MLCSANVIITSITAPSMSKPLFGCSVATCRLPCFEISLSINERKLKNSPGKRADIANLADGVTALAQLYALYSHRARFFNQ